MTQQIDALQRGASRRGQACFTMPGRPIHPESSRLVAKDDPVIAEDGNLLRFLPEPGHRGFSSPGLTGEQITLSAGVHYPAGVHFRPAARRKQMNDQQFIEGVFERGPQAEEVKWNRNAPLAVNSCQSPPESNSFRPPLTSARFPHLARTCTSGSASAGSASRTRNWVFAPWVETVNLGSSLVSAMVRSAILRSAERCNLPSSPEGAGESNASGF